MGDATRLKEARIYNSNEGRVIQKFNHSRVIHLIQLFDYRLTFGLVFSLLSHFLYDEIYDEAYTYSSQRAGAVMYMNLDGLSHIHAKQKAIETWSRITSWWMRSVTLEYRNLGLLQSVTIANFWYIKREPDRIEFPKWSSNMDTITRLIFEWIHHFNQNSSFFFWLFRFGELIILCFCNYRQLIVLQQS